MLSEKMIDKISSEIFKNLKNVNKTLNLRDFFKILFALNEIFCYLTKTYFFIDETIIKKNTGA